MDNPATPNVVHVHQSVQPARGNLLLAVLGWMFAPVISHRRTLLVVNLIYFGALGLGVAYIAVDPNVQKTLLDAVGAAFSPTGTLGTLADAYVQGELFTAIALTFVVNLVLGTVVYLTCPSLLIPFAGVLIGIGRAVLWGLLFSPFGGVYDASLLPHTLTMLIEGEAYIIAMVGVWLWWRPVFSTPGRRCLKWRQGLGLQGRVMAAVTCTLVVAAIYEALEVIYLISRL